MANSEIKILYVFAGEKAQGAEIVIERLMRYNTGEITPHLIMSPGAFADDLVNNKKLPHVTLLPSLKKLNRSSTNSFLFYLKAIRNYFVISWQVGKYIKKHKIKIVHANTVMPASYLIPLIVYCKLINADVKWLWSEHDITYFSKLDSMLSKLCVKLYDVTLVVSSAVKRKYGANPKVLVLYNGLDSSDFRPDQQARERFRNNFNLNDDDIVIGMPAVVVPRKGQLALLEVFNKVQQNRDQVYLIMAGGFEKATPGYTEQVMLEVGKNTNARHIGYIANMTDFYNGCDIIINNSDQAGSEPLGTSIYEAMACEKIVIAASTGGSAEIITDEVDGFLFEVENRAALEEKLSDVLTNINRLNHVKSAARDKVNNKFTVQKMAAAYNAIINTLLK